MKKGKSLQLKSQNLFDEINGYKKSKYPFFEPVDVILTEYIQKVLYSLAHLKIGRANYLESLSRRSREITSYSFNKVIAEELRNEADLLIRLLQLDIDSPEIRRERYSQHEVPTGQYPKLV